MSGPNTQPIQQTAAAQSALAGQAAGTSTQLFGQMENLLQPAINFNTAMASGDTSKMVQAAGPQLANIAQQKQQAQESIYSSTPRGAGQDFALAQLPMQSGMATAQTMNQAANAAPTNLANIGAGLGSMSTQELGAASNLYQGAASSQNDVMQAQAAKKQATMGFLGQMAGIGGGMASKALFGSGNSDGGGGANSSSSN